MGVLDHDDDIEKVYEQMSGLYRVEFDGNPS
jgi:hypothetical protein